MAFYKSVFQVSVFEVSVFGEMAIRGLGIPEKGFREFEFAKLTGYPQKLFEFLKIFITTIFIPFEMTFEMSAIF